MSSANRNKFTSSFPIWMTFIYFSRLIFLARTFTTLLNRSGESEHIFLLPDLRGKDFNLSLLSMMLAVNLPYMAFTMLWYVPYMTNLLRDFIMKKC